MPIFRCEFTAEVQVNPEAMGQFLQEMLVNPANASLHGVGHSIAIRNFREDDLDDTSYLGQRVIDLDKSYEVMLSTLHGTSTRTDIDTKGSAIHIHNVAIALAGLRLTRSEVGTDIELGALSNYHSHSQPRARSMSFISTQSQLPPLLYGGLLLKQVRTGDGWAGTTPRSHPGTHY